MLRAILTLGLVATLTVGCAPRSYYGFAKPDVTRETAAIDTTSCNIEANKLFPSATFTTSFYGGIGTGSGLYLGGVWGGYPGYGLNDTQVRDANADLRLEHRRDCMRLKGYTPAVHPICTKEQLNGRSYRPLPGAPAPATNICALRTEGSGIALVDLNNPI